MDQFSQPVLSKKLLTIIANSTNSTNQIIFKRAIASSDKYKLDDLSGFDDTSISTIKKASETVFSNVTIDGNGIQLTAIFSSNGNDSNYDINTILFTAEYGGQEFLAFSQIANYSLTVPAGSAKEVFNLTLKPKIIIDSVKNISTTVNPSGVATIEYVDSHDSELQKMIDEGDDERRNILTKFSDYILKSGNPQTVDTKLTFTEKINGTTTRADALATPRTINGTNFDGTANISVKASNDSDLVHNTGNETVAGTKTFSSPIVGSITGNAGTATKIQTPRKLKVNLASTADQTFDGSADQVGIGVSGLLPVNSGGTGRTDGLAKPLTTPILDNTDLNTLTTAGQYSRAMNVGITNYPSGSTGSYFSLEVRVGGSGNGNNIFQEYADTNLGNVYQRTGSNVPIAWSAWKKVSDDSTVVHNKGNETILGDKNYTGKLQKNGVDVATKNDNVASATKLATPRTIGGVAFDGTADISLPGVNTTGNQNTTGFAAGITANSIPNGTNLNDFRTTGNYDIGRVTLVNAPETYQWGLLEIQAILNGTNGVQRITDTNTGTVYTRTWNMTGGSSYNFTDWKQGGGGWKEEADIPNPAFLSSSYSQDVSKFSYTFSKMHLSTTNNSVRITGNLVVNGNSWNAASNTLGFSVDSSNLINGKNVPKWSIGKLALAQSASTATQTLGTLHLKSLRFNGTTFYIDINGTSDYGAWTSGNISIDMTVTY